ncbi:MAG: hypothetical protein UX13_C0026G0009 [Candidatus Woesebacteria bacterium GW2011_GWB1_45_5]|uniref:Uncharacterized protein n=1 Tax=Candidatus Woesebacteria bacterium GW2011_GWB1_45_5 TaxID=1618581 RepID=A0A0G1PWR0_9BACT|nr:MAG: hypothetical protein UX13_C0026G0009 [Candidatus Woesebacteria bacterium GW2011_GWB1_45_5]
MEMKITSMESYEEFISEQMMDPVKMTSDLLATPSLQDYDNRLWFEKVALVKEANKIIPQVSQDIIRPVTQNMDPDKSLDALFGALQLCLYPHFASQLSEKFNLGHNRHLIIAASHIGVARMADYYQKADNEERARIEVYVKYFAAAQAWLLGFKTSTTLMALIPEDKGLLRLGNIAVIATVDSQDKLKADKIRSIFEGYGASEIKDLGNGDKFFLVQ